jgi:hypothetical protein
MPPSSASESELPTSLLPHAPADATANRAPLSTALNLKLAWALALIVATAYVLFFVRLTSLPLEDYPNHVARALVLCDLMFHHGARFGHEFTLTPMLVPYILPDLVLATVIELFGITRGALFFTVFVLLSLPCALLFYLHVNRLARKTWPFVFLLGLYLSTDWFLLAGLMAFRLAVAALVVTLALADLLRRRWSVAIFAIYACTLLLSYLIHLSWLVFFAVVLGISGAVRWWIGDRSARDDILRRELWLCAPVITLLAWHFGVIQAVRPQGAGIPPEFEPEWGSLSLKFFSLLMPFRGFGGRMAEGMILLLALCLVWPVRHALRTGAWQKPAVLVQLVLAGAFLVIYAALPRQLSFVSLLDIRALPFIALFVLLAMLHLPPENSQGKEFSAPSALALATLLATVNLAYLVLHIGPADAWISRYRGVLRSVPEGASVLPVYSHPMVTLMPFVHAASFIVLDRGGITPYLFGGDDGDPMIYFRYRNRPYEPKWMWYDAQRLRSLVARMRAAGLPLNSQLVRSDGRKPWYEKTPAPNWQRVACDYQFILVTVPFDQSLIGVATHTIAANASGALLRVDADRAGCTGEPSTVSRPKVADSVRPKGAPIAIT